jgi:hypothetical protein
VKSFHPYITTQPPSANPAVVSSQNWNDLHPIGNVATAYTANGTIPISVDYIRATGGSGGIALVLTSSSQVIVGASGTFTVNQVYFAKKIDSGAGAVVFTDLNGALFEGQSSYSLTQQGQWAIFLWNGTGWDVFGGMAA